MCIVQSARMDWQGVDSRHWEYTTSALNVYWKRQNVLFWPRRRSCRTIAVIKIRSPQDDRVTPRLYSNQDVGWYHRLQASLTISCSLDITNCTSASSSAIQMTTVQDFPTIIESVDSVLLLATLHRLSTPQFLAPVIVHAAATARRRLVIVLFSRFFNKGTPHSHLDQGYLASQAISHTGKWRAVQEILTYVYVQATKVAQNMEKVLMDVDVLLKGMNEDVDESLGAGMEILFRVSGGAWTLKSLQGSTDPWLF